MERNYLTISAFTFSSVLHGASLVFLFYVSDVFHQEPNSQTISFDVVSATKSTFRKIASSLPPRVEIVESPEAKAELLTQLEALGASETAKSEEQQVGYLNQSQVDSIALIIKNVKPEYPENALRQELEGDVTLELSVDPWGQVKDYKVLKSGGIDFDQAALAVAPNIKFKPAEKNGVPVPVRVLWIYHFRISN